jgi:hypothetical protein
MVPFIHAAMDLLLTFHLGEMESDSNIGLFSKILVSIFKARSDDSSYISIRRIFKICNDEAIARYLVRSVHEFFEDRTCQGGRSSHSSGLDKMQVQAIVSEQSQ